jgi:hypothetical protein
MRPSASEALVHEWFKEEEEAIKDGLVLNQ